MNTPSNIANLYNPKTQSREELIEQFVVRQKTFERLYREIHNSQMDTPEQHILIEGKRGMGKTTLLLRLSYEIERDAQLQDWLLPLVFNEEEYSVRKLFKLWERILELLIDKVPLFAPMETQREALSKQFSDDETYEKEIYKLLSSQLQMARRKVILFIDNFGDMFQKFSESEAHRLRKVLQTSADIRIIAASSMVLEAFYQYKHPFYEFFKIERLEPLSASDTRELLLQLGKRHESEKVLQFLEHQRGRVETLRRLTGGVVRTMILLFEIFVNNEGDSAFADLERILDRVTPLYKHRMDDLPPQQQEIVETIALHWDAINAGEIAKRTRMESKVVSAQLQQLVKNEIVHKISTTTKNHLYQITERFFNIWYLMRNGRHHHRSRVLWLVRFLEEWCDEMEIVARSRQHISNLQKGGFDQRAAFLLSEALAYSRHLPKEEQHQLLETTREYLSRKKSKYALRLSPSELELQAKARTALRNKQYQKALPLLLQMKEKNNFLIAYTYQKGFGDYEQAEKYYLAAARQDDTAAFNNLGVLYQYQLQQPKVAEQYFQKAVELNNSNAMFNLGLLYQGVQKDYPKAQKYFQMAIAAGDADAPYNLAKLYTHELQQAQLAEELYQQQAATGDIKAIQSLATLYLEEWKNFEEAEYYFKMAMEHTLSYNLDAEDNESDQSPTRALHLPLLYLMARGCWDYLDAFFEDDKAKAVHLADRLKPFYYALMYFLQDRYPQKYLRMGTELEETVKEIIAEVSKLQKWLEE